MIRSRSPGKVSVPKVARKIPSPHVMKLRSGGRPKVKRFVEGGSVLEDAVRNFKADLSASGGSSGAGGRFSLHTDMNVGDRATVSPYVSKSAYMQKVKTPEGERTFSGSSPTEYGVRASFKFKKGGRVKK